MKLRNLFMAVIAGAFAFASCEVIEELGAPMININPTELNFEAGEGSQTITLNATLNWSVTTDLAGKWVALGQESGNASKDPQTVSVSVEENTGFDREIDIVFAAGGGMVKATLKVKQKGSQGTFVAEEGDGSKEKPYNVAQIAEVVSRLTWTSTTEYDKVGPFYVKGKIASIKEPFGAEYGNGNFTITDDGNATDPKFVAYRVYYLENKKWQEGNTQIAVGDVAVVYGEVMNYMGNTPETVQKGSYLYSLNGETVATGGQEVDYSKAEAKTVAEFIALADTKTPYKLTGEVTGSINTQYGNFDLKDATGTVKIYGVSNWSAVQDKVKKGSIVTIAGVFKDYNGTPEMVNGYILDVQGGEEIDYNNVPAKTVAEFIAAADKDNYYKLSGKVSGFNANYCSFDLTDATGLIYVYSVDNKSEWSSKIKDGGTVTLAGKYEYYANKQQHEVVNAYILSFTEGQTQDETATGNGTLESPYNPKAASDVASALEDKGKTDDVYVKGKISSVKYTFSAQYGTATFYISEDGSTNGTQFQVYSVYYLGNRAWVDGDAQVAVGDEVIICGKLTNYGGTPETSSKEAYIYSLNGQTSIDQGPVFGVEKAQISVSASATSAVIKVTGNVAWTASTAINALTLSPASGQGAGEITATFPANTDTENVVTYNLIVKTDADVATKEIEVMIVQAKASSGNASSIVIPLNNETSFAEDNGGDVLKNGFSATVEGFKVATYKYKSTSNPVTPDQYSMRVYKSAVFFIEAPAGKTIKALCFKANNLDNGKYILDMTGVEGTEGTAVASKSDETIKWEGSASTVILQAAAGQTRLVNVEVFFE